MNFKFYLLCEEYHVSSSSLELIVTPSYHNTIISKNRNFFCCYGFRYTRGYPAQRNNAE